MFDYDETRQKPFEPVSFSPDAEPHSGDGDYGEPPFSAAERHRRARMMREAQRPNPLLESLAAGEFGEFDAGIDFGEPVMEDTFGRPASRAEKGVLAGIRRFLFGRRSRDRQETFAPEPYRERDGGQYASAVASAVRMASGSDGPVRADTEFPIGSDEIQSESAMYHQPPHSAAYPTQPQPDEPARHAAPQPAPWPQAPVMQAVAVWPIQPVVGWPMPPQAFGTAPQAYGTPPQAYGTAPQAYGGTPQAYAAPPQPQAAPYLPYPANAGPYPPQPAWGWPQVVPRDPAPAAWPEQVEPYPEFFAGDEAEMEDLRDSVRALRDMVETLMQRRSERNRRAA